jgi:hypothetical protein
VVHAGLEPERGRHEHDGRPLHSEVHLLHSKSASVVPVGS